MYVYIYIYVHFILERRKFTTVRVVIVIIITWSLSTTTFSCRTETGLRSRNLFLIVSATANRLNTFAREGIPAREEKPDRPITQYYIITLFGARFVPVAATARALYPRSLDDVVHNITHYTYGCYTSDDSPAIFLTLRTGTYINNNCTFGGGRRGKNGRGERGGGKSNIINEVSFFKVSVFIYLMKERRAHILHIAHADSGWR